MGSVRVPERSLDDVFSASGLPLPIPDPGVVVATINVPQSLTIQDIDVGVTITHQWVRDLRLELERDTSYLDTIHFSIDTVWQGDTLIVSIDTTLDTATVDTFVSVVLLDFFPGDNVQNLTNTWFDQDAGQSIWEGQPPFTGAYRPIDSVSSLNRFDGTDAIGEWRLRVRDRFIIDAGVLESFLIEINGAVNLQGTVTNAVTADSLVGASIVLVDTVSTDTIGRSITNDLGAYSFSRTDAGTYRMLFAAHNYDTLIVDNVTVVEGQPTVQNAQLVPLVDFVNAEFTGPVAIPDSGAGRVVADLAVSESGRILDVDLTVNITHTYIADLTISLAHPNGDTITLFNPPLDPSLGANMANCRYDDEAANSISTGTGPFNGRFRPVDSLAYFDSLEINGTWSLHIQDYAAVDEGTLHDFTLHFEIEFPEGASPELPPVVVDNFALHPAFPNPFNSTVSLNLDVAKTQELSLQVFDITGRLVETLHHGKLNAGQHRFYWQPVRVASGIYFVRAFAQELAQTQKIVLLK